MQVVCYYPCEEVGFIALVTENLDHVADTVRSPKINDNKS